MKEEMREKRKRMKEEMHDKESCWKRNAGKEKCMKREIQEKKTVCQR
ncbi:MAG: hypothetical protein HFG58_15565 [Lachnospiraceae bacterium]|jgi:hypothetical protein|nr:hypothetical protein [Lachnospiraceae bacterium]